MNLCDTVLDLLEVGERITLETTKGKIIHLDLEEYATQLVKEIKDKSIVGPVKVMAHIVSRNKFYMIRPKDKSAMPRSRFNDLILNYIKDNKLLR